MTFISRRNILKSAGLAGIGLAVSNLSGTKDVVAANQSDPGVPWSYQSLDPEKTAQLAYDNYPGHGCMYAVCTSVINQLAEKGAPYNQFPVNMLNYGHGGCGGFGTLCGALNGAALLIGLFCHDKKESDQMISNLFQWYEQTELPVFTPSNYQFEKDLPQVVTESVICHASVSNWCMAAKAGPDDPIRTERCRRLCGDVVMKTMEILDDYFHHHELAAFALAPASAECQECHGIDEAKMFKAKTKMSCGSCHEDPHQEL